MHCEFSALERLLREGTCSLQVDSRAIGQGDIFLAVPGATEDGTRYIQDALNRGAKYVVVEESAESLAGELPADIGLCRVPDMRLAVARLAAARYHTDRRTLTLIGVTGTNGKTTVTALLEHLFTALGHKVGVLGTVTYRWPGHTEAAPLTTPDPLRLHSMLAQMEEAGCTYCVMEVSSHALAQQRVAGLPFAAVALTNVTQDHLDFHGTMDNYFACKATLFTDVAPSAVMAINSDDPYGRRLLELCPKALAYGFHAYDGNARKLQGNLLANDIHGVTLSLTRVGFGNNDSWTLTSPLLGAFNAANLLTAQAIALELSVDPKDLLALESFTGVSGRLERITLEGRAPQKHVFVDYAHTPDALVNVLQAIRAAGFERVITVFGCGGNRDRTKRPRMGEAVAKYSDIAVVTSDNPRNEDPNAIIADILPGLANAACVHVEPNRKAATALALSLATGKRDCVLIAGKGHEDYQIIRGVRHHYSDQEVVRELFAAREQESTPCA